MPYLLLLAYMIPRTTCIVTTKLNSSSFSAFGLTGSLLYTLETSIFSLPVYWIAAGCTLALNSTVWMYGALYGICSFACLILAVFMYNHGSVTLVNFVSSTVTLIASSAFGAILLGEEITPALILRVSLMLICVLTLFLGSDRSEGAAVRKKRFNPLSILLPAIYALFGLGATFIIKYFTADAAATDTNSLFFVVNVFGAVYSIPMILISAKKDKLRAREVVGICTDKRTSYAAVNTLFGGVQAIITALLIASMEVSLYTPVVTALGFICMAIATPIVRERLDRYNIAATAIAIASLFLPMLIFG